jgi:hypothetical protein
MWIKTLSGGIVNTDHLNEISCSAACETCNGHNVLPRVSARGDISVYLYEGTKEECQEFIDTLWASLWSAETQR